MIEPSGTYSASRTDETIRHYSFQCHIRGVGTIVSVCPTCGAIHGQIGTRWIRRCEEAQVLAESLKRPSRDVFLELVHPRPVAPGIRHPLLVQEAAPTTPILGFKLRKPQAGRFGKRPHYRRLKREFRHRGRRGRA